MFRYKCLGLITHFLAITVHDPSSDQDFGEWRNVRSGCVWLKTYFGVPRLLDKPCLPDDMGFKFVGR